MAAGPPFCSFPRFFDVSNGLRRISLVILRVESVACCPNLLGGEHAMAGQPTRELLRPEHRHFNCALIQRNSPPRTRSRFVFAESETAIHEVNVS
jgi:hypothetical protein